jgi:hypothetical protein
LIGPFLLLRQRRTDKESRIPRGSWGNLDFRRDIVRAGL